MTFPASVETAGEGRQLYPTMSGGNGRPYVFEINTVYIILREMASGGDTLTIEVFKSSTPDIDNWTSVATLTIADSTLRVNGVGTFRDGDEIHVVTASTSGGGTAQRHHYHVFNMSSDSFTTSNELIVGHGSKNIGSDSNRPSINLRSDGDRVVFHRGETEKIMGTDYVRLFYHVHEGTDWGSEISVDDGGEISYHLGGSILGENDKVHFVWETGNNADPTHHDVQHKSLTSANVLSSVKTLNDTDARDADSEPHHTHAPVYYDDDGVERITAAWINDDVVASEGKIYTAEIDDDGTPAAEEQASTDATNRLIATKFHAIAVHQAAKTVYSFYSSRADLDLTSSSERGNIDSGGWSADVTIHAGNFGTVTGNVYLRGTNVVLGIFFEDNGTDDDVKYTEQVLWLDKPCLGRPKKRPIRQLMRM